MRTITLELLRHGKAHNQLLSPLTPYLALCENRPAVTVYVPFEHNQLLHRLRALSYKVDDEQGRLFQLQDTAQAISGILAQIPYLATELKGDGNGDGGVTHLRLILSASELALLPFELALSPDGLPGAGQHLLLQPQTPLCLTRESRRSATEPADEPCPPRILFIAAAPSGGPGAPGVGPIPLESHLLALRRAIAPWVGFFPEDDAARRRERVAEHLVVLPNASVDAIERACSAGKFTHIHILAHGVERAVGFDRRFHVALHDQRDPTQPDYVNGPSLAAALRVARKDGGFARPAVVTLASCDSGNVGTVAGAGSSIAHALHEAGIPVVIGGQFPLSFEGSVRLVELLYEGLLWGEDPRRLLHDLRRRLFSQFRDTHDWASLMAYVSLPPSYDRDLPGQQLAQSKRSMDAARSFADRATRHAFGEEDDAPGGGAAAAPDPERRAREEAERAWRLEEAKSKVLAVRERLGNLKAGRSREFTPAEKSELLGLIASTEKVEAELVFASAVGLGADEHTRRLTDSTALLRQARDHYWEAFEADRTNTWPLTQYLSLALILAKLKKADGSPAEAPSRDAERDVKELWSFSRLLTLYKKPRGKDPGDMWAHGTLLELHLLSLLMEESLTNKDIKAATDQALDETEAFIKGAEDDYFKVYSTRRQLLRYIKWYKQLADIDDRVVKAAEKILGRFPEKPRGK